MPLHTSRVSDTVRAVLREHEQQRDPDESGRMHACTCGWWMPGTSWALHLIEVLEDRGVRLTEPEVAP